MINTMFCFVPSTMLNGQKGLFFLIVCQKWPKNIYMQKFWFLTLKSELLVSAGNDLDDDYYVVLLHYSIVGSKRSDFKKKMARNDGN